MILRWLRSLVRLLRSRPRQPVQRERDRRWSSSAELLEPRWLFDGSPFTIVNDQGVATISSDNGEGYQANVVCSNGEFQVNGQPPNSAPMTPFPCDSLSEVSAVGAGGGNTFVFNLAGFPGSMRANAFTQNGPDQVKFLLANPSTFSTRSITVQDLGSDSPTQNQLEIVASDEPDEFNVFPLSSDTLSPPFQALLTVKQIPPSPFVPQTDFFVLKNFSNVTFDGTEQSDQCNIQHSSLGDSLLPSIVCNDTGSTGSDSAAIKGDDSSEQFDFFVPLDTLNPVALTWNRTSGVQTESGSVSGYENFQVQPGDGFNSSTLNFSDAGTTRAPALDFSSIGPSDTLNFVAPLNLNQQLFIVPITTPGTGATSGFDWSRAVDLDGDGHPDRSESGQVQDVPTVNFNSGDGSHTYDLFYGDTLAPPFPKMNLSDTGTDGSDSISSHGTAQSEIFGTSFLDDTISSMSFARSGGPRAAAITGLSFFRGSIREGLGFQKFEPGEATGFEAFNVNGADGPDDYDVFFNSNEARPLPPLAFDDTGTNGTDRLTVDAAGLPVVQQPGLIRAGAVQQVSFTGIEEVPDLGEPPEFDFGDAPDPLDATAGRYPTLLANNGARHTIVAGFRLGQRIDSEPDGQPNANATGDGNDEDGVRFNSPLVAGQQAMITVTASAAGMLDAFVDFNRDGDWLDAGEQIFASRALQNGANPLAFAVPAGAAPLLTFARFRFSSAGGLAADGPAADGEVEDYRVEITVPGAPERGDIRTRLRRGSLRITGDKADHNFRVEPGSVANSVLIVGIDTTINGQPGPLEIGGVTRSIVVRLGGTNTIKFDGTAGPLVVPDVEIRTGSRNDSIAFDPITVRGDLMIASGGGNDVVQLADLVVEGDLQIRAGLGSDVLRIDDTHVHGASLIVAGELKNPNSMLDRLFRRRGGNGDADSLEIERNGAADGPQSRFDGPFHYLGSPGADTVTIGLAGEPGNSAQFGDAAFDGARGQNTIDAGLESAPNAHGNQFLLPPRIRRFLQV